MRTQPTIRPGYLRPADAAKYMSVTRRTIYEWQARRLIPFTRIKKRCVLIAVRDLDAFAARNRVEAIGAPAIAG
jgi:excisionase family DNA binding protein